MTAFLFFSFSLSPHLGSRGFSLFFFLSFGCFAVAGLVLLVAAPCCFGRVAVAAWTVLDTVKWLSGGGKGRRRGCARKRFRNEP